MRYGTTSSKSVIFYTHNGMSVVEWESTIKGKQVESAVVCTWFVTLPWNCAVLNIGPKEHGKDQADITRSTTRLTSDFGASSTKVERESTCSMG